jgi:hypothetical protein
MRRELKGSSASMYTLKCISTESHEERIESDMFKDLGARVTEFESHEERIERATTLNGQ